MFFYGVTYFYGQKNFRKKKKEKHLVTIVLEKKNENARYPFAVAPIQGVARGP